jgi:hypothetical protein
VEQLEKERYYDEDDENNNCENEESEPDSDGNPKVKKH